MDNKMKIIDEVERFIGNKLDEIRKSEELNKNEKLDMFEVLFNTHKFLINYDKNIKVLNEEVQKNKYNRYKNDESCER